MIVSAKASVNHGEIENWIGPLEWFQVWLRKLGLYAPALTSLACRLSPGKAVCPLVKYFSPAITQTRLTAEESQLRTLPAAKELSPFILKGIWIVHHGSYYIGPFSFMTTAEGGIGKDDFGKCTASPFCFLFVQVRVQVECWCLIVTS